MKLTLDRRESLKGAPASHALIVGISRYVHLPAEADSELVQLSTAAQSAYEFSKWLNDHSDDLAAPMATCRVLLAPSDAELKRIPALKDLAGPCTVSAFVSAASEWRRDAIGNKENTLILYFAGHALEPSEANPLLMFDDFGDGVGPALRATVPLTNLIDGLAPADWQREIGRRQFLFIDTDRLPPVDVPADSLRRPTDAFDVARRSPFDDRRSCTLYGTTPGGAAYTFPDSVTFFNQALLTCLKGAAAVPTPSEMAAPTAEVPDPPMVWSVTSRSLPRGVQEELDQLKRENAGEQRIAWSIQGDDAVLVKIRKPPQVILRIWLDRPELRSQVSFVVYDDRGETIIDEPVRPDAKPEWPIKIELEAGIYRVAISLGAPGPAKPIWGATVTLAPPRVDIQAKTPAAGPMAITTPPTMKSDDEPNSERAAQLRAAASIAALALPTRKNTDDHRGGSILTADAMVAVSDLDQKTDDELYAELGGRLKALGIAAEFSPTMGATAEAYASLGDLWASGRRYFAQANRPAYDLVCGSDPEDSEDRQKVAQSMGLGKEAFAATLATVLIAHLGAAPEVAPVLAVLIARHFFRPDMGAMCDVWKGNLGPAATRP